MSDIKERIEERIKEIKEYKEYPCITLCMWEDALEWVLSELEKDFKEQ